MHHDSWFMYEFAYFIGRWFMRSDNSYKGPFKFDDDEDDKLEVEDDETSWSSSSISDEEKYEHIESSVIYPLEIESVTSSSSSLSTQ